MQYNITSTCFFLWMEYAGKVYIHYQNSSATGLHALHALQSLFSRYQGTKYIYFYDHLLAGTSLPALHPLQM